MRESERELYGGHREQEKTGGGEGIERKWNNPEKKEQKSRQGRWSIEKKFEKK